MNDQDQCIAGIPRVYILRKPYYDVKLISLYIRYAILCIQIEGKEVEKAKKDRGCLAAGAFYCSGLRKKEE